ncbi:hypothetical protein Z517_06007 [Fonsecaea pedrosoi CBS 271.37]|uniref:Xylanolytic transcriptional activator regulatory domain-containing protein n=1 Tax=Fonsecaea pedrosoi CBS 271.37 TaxID=1442368 RepID=A0A0D2GLL5_9EURO|nr:uncharacterized protein Z517_06007 [Fonsecaea pedrosoi CBS 271.37]KIW79395.1 hypothetical protein Z517_06007 [Fonsecaea pedrosoi CBS 271.37]
MPPMLMTCDFQYPTCGACAAARVTCLGFDSIRGSDKPRSVVRHLEAQVAQLEIDLAAIKTQAQPDGVDTITQRVAMAIAEPTGRTRKQEPLLPLTSTYFLSDAPLPQFNHQAWDESENVESTDQSWRPMAISSIPVHVIDAMLKHYCQTYLPQYPSIAEADLYRARDRVYESPELSGYDAFVICITLAISSNTLSYIDEKRAASTTYGLWATAVVHLEQVGLTASWERLQALQLLTHYGFLNPQHVNVSHCASAASRMAFQFGLHEELPTPRQMKLSSAVLNTRRRMFWNAYGIDAAAHVVRSLPYQWKRSEITAKFPESESLATPTHSAHIWSLREIECDITFGLYHSDLPLTAFTGPGSFEAWLAQMQAQLDAWYQKVRQSVNLTEKIEFHEVLFQLQVLRLNRPSPRCPAPTKEMHKRALKASITLIKEYSVLDRLGKMFMLWHATFCVIEAGLYLLSSILISLETPTPDRQHLEGEDVSILTRYVKTFPVLFWKISRRWPSVLPHASTLDNLSTSVLEVLQRWSDGQDPSRTETLSLREKIDHMTRFPLTPSPNHTAATHAVQPEVLLQYQPSNTSSQLLGESNPILQTSTIQLSTEPEAPPNTSAWLGNRSSLDPSLPIFPETYPFSYTDPMVWDFSGLDSEEIFAALLEEA